MNQADYTIRLPVFEGPFDLLFHLVKKAEVDIWSVSVAEITEQYLAYLQTMKELNLEIASEFLVMAATLLRLKSKLLLPRPPRSENEEDEEELFDINSPEELFNRLEEYRKYKEASYFLKVKEQQQQRIFLRSTGARKVMLVNRQQSYYTYWEGAHLLNEIMLRFAKAAAVVAVTPSVTGIEDYNVVDKMKNICSMLQERGQSLYLETFVQSKQLWELIATFIALLELARQRRVRILQDRPFGRILVTQGPEFSEKSLLLKEQED